MSGVGRVDHGNLLRATGRPTLRATVPRAPPVRRRHRGGEKVAVRYRLRTGPNAPGLTRTSRAQHDRGMPSPTSEPSERRLRELAFLGEVARLATSARTWDELMRTVIDRTTAALSAEVCSLYLLDRDGTGVTLAATNGLDREQVGVARLPLGVGITGRVAGTRRPIVSADVKTDERFAWLQGLDEPRLTSMCSVPLIWNDAVVGVLNVQTVSARKFLAADVRFLETLAALLAGIVEKGRLQREAEAQVMSLRAIDEARARLADDRHPRAAHAAGGRPGLPRAHRPEPARRGGPGLGAGGAPPGGPARRDGRFDPGRAARSWPRTRRSSGRPTWPP